MKLKNKKGINQVLAIFILVIIGGVLGLGGYFLLKSKSIFNINRPPDISSWRVYGNEDYNFEIQYPSDWKLEIFPESYEKDKLPLFFNVSIYKERTFQGLRYGIGIVIEENQQNLSAEEWAKKIIENNKKSYQKGEAPYLLEYYSTGEIKISDYPGYAISGLNDLEGRVNQIYLSKDNKIFQFIYPIAEENPNYFNPIENYKIAKKILATFKFLK